MSDGRTSSTSDNKSERSWLERLAQIFQGKPEDRDELIQTLQDAQQNNLFDADAMVMMEGVLHVADMQVRDIMIPRSQMVVVEMDASADEILATVVESAHSRFPAVADSKDEIVGILLAKDLLPLFLQGEKPEQINLRDLLRPVVFIPESKRLNVLLKEFRASRNHMAIVVDEYGGVAGLVTIEDVLEQIVGEIEDEHDFEDEDNILAHSDTHAIVKAVTPVEDFNEHFGSDFSDEEFDTIGGLVMNALGHMPKRGETLILGQFHFKVLRASSRRIHLFEVNKLDEEQLDKENNIDDIQNVDEV
ncbi:MAG: transporter associated domain-containing protein [Thioalkalispiraceae bacterium]|jgi:magnesium and cobalt transporter